MVSRKYIAFVTLGAFLLNALLPFFAVYNFPADHAISKQVSSLFGEKVLICSGGGFKWIKWEDLQKQGGEHNSPSHYKCPLCYLAAHGLKDIAAPDAMVLAGIVTGDSGHLMYDDRPSAFTLQSPFSSRAPPFLSFS